MSPRAALLGLFLLDFKPIKRALVIDPRFFAIPMRFGQFSVPFRVICYSDIRRIGCFRSCKFCAALTLFREPSQKLGRVNSAAAEGWAAFRFRLPQFRDVDF
jgi:hypothetical protein